MQKTIVIVRADGSIDTSTATTWPYVYSGGSNYLIALRGVASDTGRSFYTAWGGGYAQENAGFWYVPFGVTSSSGEHSARPEGESPTPGRVSGSRD